MEMLINKEMAFITLEQYEKLKQNSDALYKLAQQIDLNHESNGKISVNKQAVRNFVEFVFGSSYVMRWDKDSVIVEFTE